MAAHALTILRQVRFALVSGRTDITNSIEFALSAPGTCCSVGFSSDQWDAVERANAKLKETGTEEAKTALLATIDTAITTVAWMDAYPMMEAVKAAMLAYIKIGTPHYKARWVKFEQGDTKAQATARAAIAGQYPLDRRAPAIG